jgi:hypothetical protein
LVFRLLEPLLQLRKLSDSLHPGAIIMPDELRVLHNLKLLRELQLCGQGDDIFAFGISALLLS